MGVHIVGGGFAVNVRITHIHRLTNDIDTVSRDQTKLVEVLVAEPDADRLATARLQLEQDGTTVVVDVMADTSDTPLPAEAGERAFALARRMALATSEPTELVAVEDGDVVAKATAPIATTSSLIALKTELGRGDAGQVLRTGAGSPNTSAKLRRLARSTDADSLTEDDLAIVAELGHVLLV